MKKKHGLAWLLGALLVTVSASGYCACGKDPECDDIEAWAGISAFTLNYSQAGDEGSYQWRGDIDPKTNDLLIHIDLKGKQPMKGEVGMVGGYVMLSRGLELPRGSEIDVIDAPVLNLRLVAIILSRLFPGGPATIKERNIDQSFNVGVKFATPSAEGYIAAPWTVRGKVARGAKDAIVFDLSLTSPSDRKGNTYTQRITGDLSLVPHAVFDDAMSLDGWRTYGVGVQVESQGGSTTYDYGAKPQASPQYKTIGDLRGFIRKLREEAEYPGVKDATKDFTGFWKEKCEEAFGLSIAHHGSEGKYTIVFCGPGGCGDTDNAHETFITGDKRYKVVSENEIVIMRASGADDTYRRCTRDTHPVLKY
jgi:hypothetical protein